MAHSRNVMQMLLVTIGLWLEGAWAAPQGSPTQSVPALPAAQLMTRLISTSKDANSNPDQANSAQHRGTWINGHDINTDVEESWPNTGKTVSYMLTVTNTTCSPQGEPKTCLLVKGQYPGPKIEAN